MRKLRVVYYQNNVSTGGVGRYILSLLRGLNEKVYEPLMILRRHQDSETEAYLEELQKRGVPVFFVDEEGWPVDLAQKNPRLSLKKKSVSFYQRIFGGVNGICCGFRFVWNVKRFFERLRPDILHFNLGYFPKLSYVCLAASLACIPRKVLTIHSIDFSRRRLAPFRKIITSAFDSIIVMNESIRKELIEFYQFPPQKIRVIYNGVDPESAPDKREETRRHLGVDAETHLVLVPARMDPLKGHEVLLNAAVILGEQISFKIFFAGDGPLEKELKQKAEKLGLGKKVLFGGFRQDMPQLYEASDFVVLPSLSEGFPYVLLEAMIARKPVIGTDVGGVRTLVGEDGAGIVVPAGNADSLARALQILCSESTEALRQRGEKGFNRVREHFSRQQMLEKTFLCYQGNG